MAVGKRKSRLERWALFTGFALPSGDFANVDIADVAPTLLFGHYQLPARGLVMMKWMVVFVGAIAANACGQANDSVKDGSFVDDSIFVDRAPYEGVTEAGAPTVKDLENRGYSQVDHYPVGCTIPDQPDAACDATGAVFMDKGKTDNADIPIEDEEYDRYEFVCPAIEGKNIAAWKCRHQERSNR